MTEKPKSPWVSWWLKPRETIQRIIDHDTSYLAVPLVLIGGVFNTLDRASIRSLGDSYDLTTIILMALIIGPIGGLIGWFIFSALLKWTGSWISGRGDSEAIKAALAWANVPIIAAGLLYAIELPLFGHELFTTQTPRIDSNPVLLASVLGLSLVEIVIAIWAFILFLRALGQVQGFSAWKALLNSVMAGAVFLVPLIALAFTVAGLWLT